MKFIIKFTEEQQALMVPVIAELNEANREKLNASIIGQVYRDGVVCKVITGKTVEGVRKATGITEDNQAGSIAEYVSRETLKLLG